MRLSKMLLLVLLLILSSSCTYPTPKRGIYNTKVHIVDNYLELWKYCPIGSDACATAGVDPCRVYLIQETWEMWVEHEMAHCFGWNHFSTEVQWFGEPHEQLHKDN